MDKIVEVRIEISNGSRIKYEFDKTSQTLICDRFLHTPFAYPFNYGYIVNTLAGDGDALDAVVICKHSLHPTCSIKCRIIGALQTEDENGEDTKILLVPSKEVDPYSRAIFEHTQLDEHTLEDIRYFFEHYKDLEKGKFVTVKDFISSDAAYDVYIKSLLS